MPNCKSFTVVSNGGYFDYPLPPESPFAVRISLRGVDAQTEIERAAAAGPFVTCAQVHGKRVIPAESAPLWPEREKADGLLVSPGAPALGLRFADCAPVVVLCLGKNPWLLALHSGFKGTLQNIVASGFTLARQRYGQPSADELYAWVGPCISGTCYTRRMEDPATVQALESFAPEAVTEGTEYAHIDLKRQIARQLLDESVPEERIWLESQCTCCRPDLFYSYRRAAPDCGERMLLTVRAISPKTTASR